MILPRDGRMHFSNLKHFDDSPMHYLESLKGFEDTPSMKIGRAVHRLVLLDITPKTFGGRRAGKEWDAVEDKENTLNMTELEKVCRMAESVFKNLHAMEILKACDHKEHYLEWELEGIPFGGTPDAFGTGVVLDLKTTQNAFPKWFLRDAEKRNYHAQLPMYDYAINKNPGNWAEQYIIAVENSAPYNSVVVRLDDLRIDQGWEKIHGWIEQFKDCTANGFTGYDIKQPYIWDGNITIGDAE